jgi:outer membrane protein TolC
MRLALTTLALVAAAGTAAAEPRKLTLEEAVQLALRVEPLVAEAHLGEDRSRLGVLRAQLDRVSLKLDGQIRELWNKTNIGGPQLFNCSLGGASLGTATRSECMQFGGVVGDPAADSQWQGLSNFQASLNYFLFSGFKVEANIKRAKIQDKAALVQIRQQRKDTALAVARAYWTVRRVAMLQEVQERALQRMLDAERVVTARVNAGLAPPIDKNRTTSRRLTQMATLEDLRGQAREAATRLSVTLGVPDEIELVDLPQFPDAMPPSPVDLVREALARRPEVVNARLQVEVQHQNVVIARSGFFPQINLVGLFQYGNNQFNISSGASNPTTAANPFGGLSGALTLGATLNMNFFDTLNTYTATADARYVEKINQEEVRRFERLVDGDVRGAYAVLAKLYARRVPLAAARDVAADNLKILEARYKNGDALIIDYLDGQIDLANAELNLADVTAQLQAQWLELQAALGFTVGVDHG